MTWRRGSSSNGSPSSERFAIAHELRETPAELSLARYERKRGHLNPPSYNFGESKWPFVLISAWVCTVANTGKSTLLRHDGCRIFAEWADRILPPGVHYGAHIHVIGNLLSFNVGSGFHIVNACLLDVAPQVMIKAALEKYPDAVIPPRGKTIRRKAAKKVEA